MKVIGISGISGSGKTTLTKELALKLNTTSLYWDEFDDISKSPDDMASWQNQGKDYNAFDVPLDIALARRTIRDFKNFETLKTELEFYIHCSRSCFLQGDIKQQADLILDHTYNIEKIMSLL